MPQRISFRDFVGGINNNIPSNQIQDNEVVDALNVIFDKKNNFQVRPGLTRINWNKNLLVRTEEFNNPSWLNVGNPIITPNTDISPTGVVSADTIEDDNPSSPELVYQQVSCQDGEKYTFSVYIRKNILATTFPLIQIAFLSGTTQKFGHIIFNHSTGQVLTGIGGGVPETSSVEEIDNDWYRVSLSLTNNSSGNIVVRGTIAPSRSDGVNLITTTGSVVFWGAQLELGLLSSYHVNTSVAPSVLNNYLFNKITSILDFRVSNGSSAIIITSGSSIWRLNSDDYFENITGGLTLPNNTYWQWVIYDDAAIGVNRGTGANTNPVRIVDVSSNAVALGGSPPNANGIEVWKDRVWTFIGNTITGSALGNAEDWTTTGAAGSQSFEPGGEEGDTITAIKVFRDRLFIFKSDHIYYIQPGDPDTDITNYEIKDFSTSIGCISPYGIQQILQDLIFPSRNGLTTLTTIERFGDFAETVVSNKIDQLSSFRVEDINSASGLVPSESQYFFTAPLLGGSTNSSLWVMDYTNLSNGVVGFTRFDGKIIGATLGNILYNGQTRLYVGGYAQTDDEGICYLYRYGDNNVYDDDGKLYNVLIESKSHNASNTVNNSIFLRVYYIVELITSPVNLSLSYKFNESSAKIKSWAIELTGDTFIGAAWDNALWDTDLWASPDTLERVIKRKVLGSPGRIARSIQFIISNVSSNQAFRFKEYGFDFEVVSHKKD